jgi:arylsulfatase A-like enzyme/predicted Zn-dependent protease
MEYLMKNKLGNLCFLLAAVAGVIWIFNSRREPKHDIRNIVLISIDTCRADYLSCYGFSHKTTPNIDAVAAEAVLFENVLSPVPLTLPAHSSMMTGTIPPYHGVHENQGYRLGKLNLTLAELLKDKGFTTGAVISAFVMDSQFGLNQGFDTYDDNFDEELNTIGIVERRGSEASDHAISWIEHHKDESFFLFLHYYDPHLKYVPPEPFKSLYAGNPYAGEIAYTDYCIGRVIDKLKMLGLYDSSLIIITGDHGESLNEHGEASHGYYIYESVLKVPLIFKLPEKKEPKRITERVGLVDIFPTVCQLLDIEIPSEIHGADLSGHFSKKNYTPGQRAFYCESLVATKYDCNPLLGVIAGDWKYIQTTRAELYDLSKDPTELSNVIENQPQRARILQDKLIRILEQQLREDTDSDLDLSVQDVKRLESLGYVRGDINENFEFDQSKDDAKDLLQLHMVDSTVITRLAMKDLVSAKKSCNILLEMRPDYDMVYQYLGTIASEEKEIDKALSYFKKFIELSPDKHEGYTDIALTLGVMDRFEEAIEYLNKALELEPGFADNYYHLGVAYAHLKKLDEAVANWEKALALKKNDVRIYIALADALAHLGNLDRAVIYWKEVLKLEPENITVRGSVANTLLAKNKVDEVIYHWKEMVRLSPGLAEIHSSLGDLLWLKGKRQEAVEHLAKAVELRPDLTKVLNNLAWIKAGSKDAQLRDPQKAIELAERACRLEDFKNPEFLDTLSVAYAAVGKFDEAIETAKKAEQIYLSSQQQQNAEQVHKRLELYQRQQPYYE